MTADINFVEVNAETISNDLVSDFEQALGVTLYPGDERRIFLEQQTQVIVALYNHLNDAAKQNLLMYARGPILDALGNRTNTPRLEAQVANVTLSFTLSAAQPTNITIPIGTRATPDGELFFETSEELIIVAGQTTGEVTAVSTETGEVYNGFTSGQINQLVDPVPFVASVTNIDTSSSGADIEPDDDGVNIWSGYRERIRQSPNKLSTAGSRDGYIFWAKTADANIQDVAVTFPETIKEFDIDAFQTAYPEADPTDYYIEIPASKVKITVLMKNGEMPTDTVLNKVLEACSDKQRRPMTDYVTAATPTQSIYNIEFTYYISVDNEDQEANIRSAIEDSSGAVEQYKAWQNGKLGRAINPDELRKLVLNANACKIDITSPTYTEILKDEIPSEGTVTVNYGGLI